MYTLTVVDFSNPDSSASPAKHPITKDYITIGRGKDNDIVIIQSDISKRHAAVRVTDQGIYLEDLGSTNGTMLNDLPVTSPVRVYEDDDIHMGLAKINLANSPLLQRGATGAAGRRDEIDQTEPFPFDDGGAPSQAPRELPSIPDIPPMPNSGNMPDSDGGSPFPFLEGENLSPGGLPPGRPSFPFDIPDEPPPLPARDPGTSNLVEKIRKIESQAIKSKPPAKKPGADLVDKIKDIESRALSRTPDPAAKPPPAPSPKTAFAAPEQANPATQSPAPNSAVPSPAPMPATQTAIIVTVAIPGQGSGVEELTKPSTIIGRAPESDLCLPQPLVSSRHAILELGASSQVVLRDIGSTNGTFVNGNQITAPTVVDPNDEIFIGDCRLQARVDRVPVREPGPGSAPSFPAVAPVPTVQPPPAKRAAPAQAPFSEPEAPVAQSFPPASQGAAPMPPTPPGPGPQNAPPPQASSPGFPEPVGGFESPPSLGIADVAVLLAATRKALSSALEIVQGRGEDIPKTRRLCTGMARAASSLYAVKDSAGLDALQAAANEAVGHIKDSLAALKEDQTFTEVDDLLIRASSLLYPLTSENLSHPQGAAPLWNSLRTDAGPRASQRRHLDDAHLDPEMKDHVLLAHAVFRADKKYLATARKTARSIAFNHYLDDQQTLMLENVVDEACSNVIDHAFDDPEQGAFAISFYTDQDDERLIVNIDDRGLPFDVEKANLGHMDGMGVTLMRAFCSEVRFLSRGRFGKRVQLEMDLPGSMSGLFSTFAGEKRPRPTSSVPVQYRIEDLHPERAEEIPRSVYRACGYDHYDESLYDVGLLRSQLQNGTRIAVIALSQDDKGVGQASAVLSQPCATVGELQTPLVASQLRGGSLTGQLTQRLVEKCRQQGLWALTSRLSTAHPYEQIAFNNLGAVPTGLVLGAFPDRRPGDDPREKSRARLSGLDVFLGLGAKSSAVVHAPSTHVPLLEDIYRAAGLERTFAQGAPSAAFAQESRLDVTPHPWGAASVVVEAYGRDLLSRLDDLAKDIRAGSFFCITVDLPMSSPAVIEIVPHLEKLGYSFSGVVPRSSGEDFLRMRRADSLTPERIELHVEGNLGKRILDHVLKERARLH